MGTEINILKLLLNNREERFTIKKIAESLKINYRIAYEKVMLLDKGGLIKITRIGNSKISAFTNKFNSKVFEAEFERKMDLFKNKDFLILHNRLAELTFPFIALLFGSQAKGTANKYSDIDILVIGGDEKEIKATLSLLPDKIHLTHMTYGDFMIMAKSKEYTDVS